MTIKTAVTLATGAAVGFLFGLETDEKTKERIASAVRRKIFHVLGAEEPKKYDAKYANYSKYRPNHVKDKNDWLDYREKTKIFIFEDKSDADMVLNQITDLARGFKTVSVFDICYIRNKAVDREWNYYGWTEEEVMRADVCRNDDGKWMIVMPCNPKYLCM